MKNAAAALKATSAGAKTTTTAETGPAKQAAEQAAAIKALVGNSPA